MGIIVIRLAKRCLSGAINRAIRHHNFHVPSPAVIKHFIGPTYLRVMPRDSKWRLDRDRLYVEILT